MTRLWLYIVLLLLPIGAAARELAMPDSLHYELQFTQSLTDGRNTPFWLTANREGLGITGRNGGLVRAALLRPMTYSSHWGWGAGADLMAAWNHQSPFTVRQLYGQVRYRAFMLTLGSKVQEPRYSDHELGSGDMLFSSNTLPIPQARLSIPRWIDVPGIRHLFGVKAYISYGFFSDSNWQESWVAEDKPYNRNVLFHSKGLHVHLGPTDGPLYFEGGLEMAAQFGGRRMIGDSVAINMPNSLKDFFKALIPSSGDENTPRGEQTNIYGNHVGEWSARLTWHPAPGWTVQPYYLHFFDDHSMMFAEYVWKDCLAGIRLEFPANPWIRKVVYEYLSTTDQSGPVYWDHTPSVPEQVSGRDNYYNNHIYCGWQHWGMGIGNPLVISPIYNADRQLLFECNRVRGHHIGILGTPSADWSWRVLASYTRGWGSYAYPYPEVRSNCNLLLEATWNPRMLKGWRATLGAAADWGELLGRSYGMQLTITKSGIL